MLLLAIDTSSKNGSVAVFDGNSMIGCQNVEGEGHSASQLTPTIRSTLADLGIEIATLGCVAVATGPGSFTGLRVGVTTAKVLAYALNCKVLGVNSLTAIAAGAFENVSGPSDLQSPTAENLGPEVVVTIDAQRQQLFALRCKLAQKWRPQPVGKVEIIERSELASFASETPVLGPGLERLTESQLGAVHTLKQDLWACSPEKVGRHAIALLESGESDDFWSLKPNYFRASSAEEKLQLSGRKKL